ncbi:hypothetical protein QBC46DRAFT_450114 [Diplogelasinospora grovesii]|uniref:BZIP domain-containing protein n=1 Tax=Diplogelasinospora grovesii TaxID=303347 RepID=A0AAN6N7Q0_9PEZI|nr:hypothetical protein QBC46DRAFT_450114 [Diplogelasinospora grovesii]
MCIITPYHSFNLPAGQSAHPTCPHCLSYLNELQRTDSEADFTLQEWVPQLVPQYPAADSSQSASSNPNNANQDQLEPDNYQAPQPGDYFLWDQLDASQDLVGYSLFNAGLDNFLLPDSHRQQAAALADPLVSPLFWPEHSMPDNPQRYRGQNGQDPTPLHHIPFPVPSSIPVSQPNSALGAQTNDNTPSGSASEPSDLIPVPENDHQRLIVKRARNKVAAARCRQKKVDRIKELETEVEMLKRERDDLRILLAKQEAITAELRGRRSREALETASNTCNY